MGFWNKAGGLALKAGAFAVQEMKAAGDRSFHALGRLGQHQLGPQRLENLAPFKAHR